MAQFSGAVKLADLNDFITPSQACVVNIHGKKEGGVKLDFDDLSQPPEVRPSVACASGLACLM
jgi:hypothetical protein